MQIWRRAAGVGTCRTRRGMELWRSGGSLQACRCGDVEVWRSGALEACCGFRDVQEEAQRYRSSGDALQALSYKRYGDLKLWRRGARSDVEEAQRFGALEMRCSRNDIEVWRCGALEARCRRVDVEL